MYILSSAFSSVIFSPATSFLCKQPILHLHLIHSTVSLWCHRLSAWNNIWKLHLKWIFLKLQHRLLHCLVWNHSTQRYYIINWPFVLLLPLLFFSNSASPRPPPPPTLCVRWSSHPWIRRAMPTCRGLWSQVRRPKEESTPSTRPLFSNIHPPCPILCVCAFQRLPCTGAPPRSWARATHAAAPPHRLKK